MARKKQRPKKQKRSKISVNPLSASEIVKHHLVNFEEFLQIDISTQCNYNLSNFHIYLQDTNCNYFNAKTLYMHFKENSNECFLCWEEVNEAKEAQVKFSYAKCGVPYEVLNALKSKILFNLIIDSENSEKEKLFINLHISPKLILPLCFASERLPFSEFRSAVQLVVKYFHGVSIQAYEKGIISNEIDIEELYSGIKNCFNRTVKSEEVAHPFLVPKLREYQKQAVNWMVKSETQFENENKLHILYEELKTNDGFNIYYHKYGGIFVTQKFAPYPLCKGGILADEMGLGKTVEVLACILLHPRKDLKVCKKTVSSDDENSVSSNDTYTYFGNETDKQYMFDHDYFETNSEDSLECVCGKTFHFERRLECHKCGLQQHANCVLAKPDVSPVDYMCPYCWVDPSTKPVPSQSTLIVSPSTILFQWSQEIGKHIKKGKLKVFHYLGIEHHKFINPVDLADHDIVLSSYEIFRKELSHINVPHGETQRSLRHPKKFRTLPSPLSAIEWWRICLDEAQMVESITAKTTQMALELQCINRWCVTGTPIQKSFEDLYGLILFLGCDPYHVKEWWNELVSKPFTNGNSNTLNFVLNSVLWRTSKSCVLDQIDIPQQETIIHFVHLSQIEKVFYDSMHAKCQRDFIQNVQKYECEDVNLRFIDKHVLAKILLPLKNLQKACSHFQLTGGKFADIQRKKMTIPELLDYLLTKATYDSEEMHRKLILSLNGLAGIFAVKEDYRSSCEMYRKVLISVKETITHIRTDILQQVHTYHNYAEVVSIWSNNLEENDEMREVLEVEDIHSFIKELKRSSNVLCENYLQKFQSIIESCKSTLDEINNEIIEIKSQFKCERKSLTTSMWWFYILGNLKDQEKINLVLKIKELLMNAPGSEFLMGRPSVADRFNDSSGLAFVVVSLSDELHETRSSLVHAVKCITSTPSTDALNSAIACHLRPTPRHKAPKCLYCKADVVFKQYESKLFRFEVNVSSSDESDTETTHFPKTRHGTHSDSELEFILKEFVNYSRSCKGLTMYTEDGCNELKLFAVMKKEFKNLRNTWMKMHEYVCAIDELEMAKITMRLLIPGEEPPNPPVAYIILPQQLQTNLMQLQSDVIVHQAGLKKKLGHLFYLQNLQKAKNGDGPLEQLCPVCHQTLENSWSVLQCGHSFCNPCVAQVLMQSTKKGNQGFRCPVCREITSESDIYCANNAESVNEFDSDNDEFIKGHYSAKISSVVKCLMNIQKQDSTAKSLVFSSWPGLLEILAEALLLNEIPFTCINDKKSFEAKKLESFGSFKQNPMLNVLLIPLHMGANGLNIVEATHVLLIEPVMDNSKVLQAIGRVHRIGQTKRTFVHKFVIKNTIDENIYQIYDTGLLTSPRTITPVTVKDLMKLFGEE